MNSSLKALKGKLPATKPTNPSSILSLDQIGVRNNVDQSSSKHGYLESYQYELSECQVPITNIVILSHNNPIATANTFAEFYNIATIHLIWLGASNLPLEECLPNVVVHKVVHFKEIQALLAAIGRIQAIVEDGENTRSSKVKYFDELFYHLVPNGIFVTEDLHASHLKDLNDTKADDIGLHQFKLIDSKALPESEQKNQTSNNIHLSNSIKKIVMYGKISFVTKQGNHLYKVRDDEINDLLDARYGDEWGEVFSYEAGGTFTSPLETVVNREELRTVFPEEIKYPELYARSYNDVVCRPGQVVIRDGIALPDSFRLSIRGNIHNRHLIDANYRFAVLPDALDSPERVLHGSYYYLDREWSAYGHVPTEVISRLWAWDHAKRKDPQLKALVSAPSGQTDIPGWERELISAYGIASSDIVVLAGPARIERLIAATPMFAISDYVHPKISSIWARIRDSLIDSTFNVPELVFFDRPDGSVRQCRNAPDVVELFRKSGYAILRPEEYSLGQQFAIVSNAKVLAGFAGSAMLNLVFATGTGTRMVIGTDSFRNTNEYLISSIHGGKFIYDFCNAEIQQPTRGWSQKAYHSPFSVDMKTDGVFLEENMRLISG